MDLYCTRPSCPKPHNHFPDLDDPIALKSINQKFCTSCGMPLILGGRYLPQRLLGQGGFGAAFLARDRYTPKFRPCVVKLFQPSANLNPAQLKLAHSLFEREAEVLEDLGNAHPQIPDLFAFFELAIPGLQPQTEDQFFYIVQEFIDGQTMEEELAQKGQLASDDVLAMLIDILKVLKFVHDQGAIHRDIKPSNIMRHRDGSFYLLDFGAVKQATNAGSNARSTGIYSQGFAPPEQVSGGQVYPCTDLYALAVTCIMLLTGEEPGDLYDSYRNTWQWRSHAPQTRSGLADVLDRLLQPSPSDRYQSVTEVVDALKQSLQSPTPVPPPPANSPVPAPTSAPNVASMPPTQLPKAGQFSTLELISHAAFTGFTGGMIGIAIVSFAGVTLISGGFWLVLLAGLIALQSKRVIERADLPILATVALLGLTILVAGVKVLPLKVSLPAAIFIAVMTGLAAVVVMALFRLIYKLLSSVL